MDLHPYVEALAADLEAAAAAGTEETRETARRLAGALDASLRLCLVDAMSAVAAEVTAATDLGSVEIRMHGREPQVVVLAAEAPPAPAAPPPPEADDDEGGTARVSLRLPEPLKAKVETCAAGDGLSVNAWLVRAVAAAVHPAATSSPLASPLRGRRITGYARS